MAEVFDIGFNDIVKVQHQRKAKRAKGRAKLKSGIGFRRFPDGEKLVEGFPNGEKLVEGFPVEGEITQEQCKGKDEAVKVIGEGVISTEKPHSERQEKVETLDDALQKKEETSQRRDNLSETKPEENEKVEWVIIFGSG